ncbi:MAG: SCP2 sterol-binding domain-containing protein [Candidatus Hodarchaeota archaeon]
MSVDQLKKILIGLTNAINQKPDAKKMVDEWIASQYGKVIGWKVRHENQEHNFHMVFTKKDGVKFIIGEYPACDMMFIGDLDTLLGIMTGKKKTTTELKSKALKVYGSLHEGINLGKIMRVAFIK